MAAQSWLDPETLADAREALESSLVDECQLLKYNLVINDDPDVNTDGMGGYGVQDTDNMGGIPAGGDTQNTVENPPVIEEGYTPTKKFPCRVVVRRSNLSESEQIVGNEMQRMVRVEIVLPWYAQFESLPENRIELEDKLRIRYIETGVIEDYDIEILNPHSGSISFHVQAVKMG